MAYNISKINALFGLPFIFLIPIKGQPKGYQHPLRNELTKTSSPNTIHRIPKLPSYTPKPSIEHAVHRFSSPSYLRIRSLHTTSHTFKEVPLTPTKLPVFQYRDYPKPPEIVYTSCPKVADEHLSKLKGPALGLDLEWCPGTGGISLVQLGDKDLIVLFQLDDAGALPQKAINLINDPNIYKVGVNIKGDLTRLHDNFDSIEGFKPTSFLELSRLARMVEPEWRGKGKRLISLADQCEHYLGKMLDKDDTIRQGNWAGELNEDVIDYAANDVYSSLKIYEKLLSMSESRNVPIDYTYLCVDHDPPSKTPSYRISPVDEVLAQHDVPPTKYTIAGRECECPAWMKKPAPAEIRALDAFIRGVKVEDYAEKNKIKVITVQTYISNAINKFGMSWLTDEEKERFLHEAWKRPPGMPAPAPSTTVADASA